MIGTVSCVLAGVPCLFTLHESGIWEVNRGGPVPDALLSAAVARLDAVVDAYGGPSDGPFGPGQIAEAADLLGGVPYVGPKGGPPGGVVY